MTWAKPLSRTLVVSAIGVLAAPPSFGQMTADRRLAQVFDQIQPSVCKVVGVLAGSGFVWRDPSYVVTALHLVGGSASIRVTCATTRAVRSERSAQVVRVLLSADLALLKLDSSAAVSPIPVATARPARGERLMAAGFSFNTSYVQPRPVTAALARHRLDEIVPPRDVYGLKALGIDTKHDVIHLDGALVPGLSGAPVVNALGELVAIGNGGLAEGAASISWAIPADRLIELLASDDRMPDGAAARSRVVFGAEVGTAAGGTLLTGPVSLAKVRSRELGEMAESTDDKMLLNMLLATPVALRPNLAPEKFKFDIYQDSASGATVVLPASASEVVRRGNVLLARSASGRVEMKVEVTKVDDAAQVDSKVYDMELHSVPAAQHPEWIPDPSWTFPVQRIRDDGVAYTRKGYGRMVLGSLKGYMFVTLAARSNVIVGAWAISSIAPNSAMADPEFLREWTEALIATHLTTFAR